MDNKTQYSHDLRVINTDGQLDLSGDIAEVTFHVPRNHREANGTAYTKSYKIASINNALTLHDGKQFTFCNPVEKYFDIKFSGTEPGAVPRLEVIIVKRKTSNC